MKANERDSRTEQERFIDRMLKEILGGQRNPGDRLPTESELAAQYDLRKTNVHLALKELGGSAFWRSCRATRRMSHPIGSGQIWRRWRSS